MENHGPIPLPTEETLRLISDFIERYDVLEAQLSVFRPIARRLVDHFKVLPTSKYSTLDKQGATTTIPRTNTQRTAPSPVTRPERAFPLMQSHHQLSNQDEMPEINAVLVDEDWAAKINNNDDSEPESPLLKFNEIANATSNMLFEAVEKSSQGNTNLFNLGRKQSSKRGAEKRKFLAALSRTTPELVGVIATQPAQDDSNNNGVSIGTGEEAVSAGRQSQAQQRTISEHSIARKGSDIEKKETMATIPRARTQKKPPPPPLPPQKVGRSSVAVQKIKKAAFEPAFNDQGSHLSLNHQMMVNDQLKEVIKQRTESLIWSKGINPMSTVSVVFDVIFSCVYFLELILIPPAISYDFRLPLYFTCIVSAKNFIEICVELITFRENHHAISAIKEPTLNSWRVHYLYNRLPVDLITTFPFELLPVTGAEYLWAVRLLRMYKLAYIASTCPIYKHAKKQLLQYFKIGHSVSLIFPLTFIFLSFMHIQACSIFLAGRLLGFSNAEIDPYKNQAFFDQYAWSLYMAATNMFPVGYHPVNSEEQLITVFFVIAGAAIYACIVGVISSIAMGVDASGRLYKQKIDELKDYMQYKLIEPVTQRKILKYYELKYRGKYFEEGSLLQDMNDSLRMEVAIHNCRELISKVPFLRREQGDGRDDLFAGQITSALEPCYYVPGDFVFVQGDIGKDMYFIASGTVCVKISGKGVAFLKDGAFFGEMALVANSPRTATIQAVSTCILYKLRQESFESICRVFTDVKHNLEMTYAERLEKVQKIENAKKTTIARIMVFKMSSLVNLDNDAKTAIVETLANVLAPVNFFPGFVVLKQGDDDALFVVETGEVCVFVDGHNVKSFKRGEFFWTSSAWNEPFVMKGVTVGLCYKVERLAFVDILREYREQLNGVEEFPELI